MKLEIKNKKENPLLSRIEVSGTLTFAGVTPSNEQVAQSIASQLKVDVSVIKMQHIYTVFGEQQAEFTALVYKTKADLDKIEPRPKKQREKEAKAAEDKKKTAEEAKAPAEAKPEEKKEAKPEEKKEAKPEEKKEAKPEEKKEAKPEEKKEAKPEEKKEAPKEEKKGAE